MRAIVPDPDADGLRAYVTGEAGFAADQAAALEGIDETLLAVTLVLVLVCCCVIYRSPMIALVPLLVVGDRLPRRRRARLRGREGRRLPGDRPGDGDPDRADVRRGHRLLPAAARPLPRGARRHARRDGVALRRTAPAIVSAGGIVVAVMLVLGVADYNATRWMGPVLAIGTAVTVLAGRHAAARGARGARRARRQAPRGHVWPRIGALVAARPARARPPPSLAVLVAGALGNLSEQRHARLHRAVPRPAGVGRGPAPMQEKFPPGQAGPVDVLVATPTRSPRRCRARRRRLRRVDLDGLSRDGAPRARAASTLQTRTRSPSRDRGTIPRPARRSRATQRPGARSSAARRAEILDSETALARRREADRPARARARRSLIVAVLLRALIAPLYVIGTVLLSYAFALGVTRARLRASSDPAHAAVHVRLPGRARRRLQHLPARPDPRGARRDPRAWSSTGGVITSAGLILAGTFCTLLATELREPVPGRLHGRARPAGRHVPDPDLPRALDRAASRIKGAMSETPCAQPSSAPARPASTRPTSC